MIDKYKQKALDLLNNLGATCTIIYGGVARNEKWKEKEKRNWYDVTIRTPKGEYSYVFWDSINNTQKTNMTLEQYVRDNLKCELYDLPYAEKAKASRDLQVMKDNAVPDEYDVISCLQLYDVGTFKDFCDEFGCDTDSRSAEQLYLAVNDEYKNLSKIFTEDQLERLADLDTEYEYDDVEIG